MTYANDKDETHSLSCPFCNKGFNAKGKMLNGNNLSSLQNTAKCEKSLEHPERSKKKRERGSRDT